MSSGRSVRNGIKSAITPPGASAGRCVLALNQEYIEKDSVEPLKDGDEVALIPPISGG